MGILGRARWGASRQISTDCMIWRVTSGNTAKIGTIRRKFFVCSAVHRGTTPILSESSLHFAAFTRQIVVVRTPAFVVFLWGSLQGEVPQSSALFRAAKDGGALEIDSIDGDLFSPDNACSDEMKRRLIQIAKPSCPPKSLPPP
jgi:hypothetical protein